MKKIQSILLVAFIATMVSCGPSADEKAAMEKAIQDSIAVVQKAYDDSLEAAASMAMEKVRQDSIAGSMMEQARLDSLAASKKKTVKKTNEQKIKEDKKVLQKQKG